MLKKHYLGFPKFRSPPPSMGEGKGGGGQKQICSPSHRETVVVSPFMVRQAHHERPLLTFSYPRGRGTVYSG